MEKVIEVLNRMQADGVFEKFAIGGGIAALYYLEPYQTDDKLLLSFSPLITWRRNFFDRAGQKITCESTT